MLFFCFMGVIIYEKGGCAMIKFSLDEKERLYSPGEIADILSVTPSAVTNWLSKGQMNGFKAGGRWRIRGDDVFRFVEESTAGRER